MSSGHNGHSVPNNRGARNNRRGRNGPQHVPVPPRGPQAATVVPTPRPAPKTPQIQPVNARPPQPGRGAPPPREIDRRQNGHAPTMPTAPSARPAPIVPRTAEGGPPMPRIVPVTSEPIGEMPSALPSHAEAEDVVEIVALYAETTVVVETAYVPERPRAAPIEHAPDRPRMAPIENMPERPRPAPIEHPRPPFARSGPIQQAREFEGDETPTTGVQPAVRPPRHERTSRDRERYVHVPGTVDVRGDVGPLIDDLHAIFERDRAVASQGNTARCGFCYYHFSLNELTYRDAGGFYICPDCEKALGAARITMLRRQQRN